MTDETEVAEGTSSPAREWRPSGRPQHRTDERSASLVARPANHKPWRRRLADFLTLPTVKIVIGAALFIMAAIAYDVTISDGSWTERAEKPKPTARAPR